MPSCYVVIVGPLSTLIQNRQIEMLFDLPVRWPWYLYMFFLSPLVGDSLADHEILFFLFIIICDVILYTTISYFALFAFAIRKQSRVEIPSPPPPRELP